MTIELYHNPLSANSRRIWITLLEKEIPFDLKVVKLDGDQFQPSFLAINPFHRVPVLVDDGFAIVESLAILDYLEMKYPNPPMLPTDPRNLATVRMVEIVSVTELIPATIRLIAQVMNFVEADSQKLQQAKEQIDTVLDFFEKLLGVYPYLGGDRLTLADITAGTTVPQLPQMGLSLDAYPKLVDWSKRLMERPTWIATEPKEEEVRASLPLMETLIKARLY